MKKVEIKNKVVARGGGKEVKTSAATGADLSGVLMKSVWDEAFEVRTTAKGETFLFGKLPFALQYGFTIFANGEKLDLPSIFEGIPFDNKTIWLNPETKVVEVIGGAGEEGGGSADFSNVLESGSGNAYTSFVLSDDGKSITFVKGETFAKQADYEALNTKVVSFLEGSDTDTIINKWKELETFLSGMKESDNLATILSGKADKGTTLSAYGITDAYTKTTIDSLIEDFVTSGDVNTLLEDYLPLTGGTITGNLRLRTGSEYISPYLYFGDSSEVWLREATDTHLTIHANGSVKIDSPITSINGIEIKKSQDDVLFVDANLVVRGGITMYGTDGATATTIWDDAPIASTSVKGIASFDSNYFAVNNGKVTFIGSTGGGTADSVAWDDVTGKPTWIGSSKPSYSYTEISGTPTSLKNPTSLSWSGYNSGSYDGSAAKSFVIPNNTNQLTNGAGFITSSDSITGNAATATKVLVTGSSSNGSYRLVFSDMSAGTSANNSLYVDSVNEGARYNPSTNRLSSASFLADATGGYYIHNTDYRVYADSGEFIINTPTYFSLRIGGTRKLYMNSNGWIGIGNSDPSGSLHVNQSAWNNGIILNRTVSGGGSGIAVHSNGIHIGNFGINGSKEFEFSVMSGSSANVKMTVDSSGNGLFYGGITMYSDARKKTILNHVELTLKQVADAPIIEHYYNSDEKKTTHVGSIAQYWAGLNDWFCKEDGEGFLTMEIQNAALASAISVARELMRYESKTDKQIRLLKKRICELEDEIETLKSK